MSKSTIFESILKMTDSEPPWHILLFPKSEVADFGFTGNLRRVVCTLNGVETFNCALFPSKENYFITLNKGRRNRLGLDVGDSVTIELKKDESKYGLPMPDELAEVLRQDAEGDRLFHALSPGNQRLMIKLVLFVKDPDLRISRALAGIDLLKRASGEFDYHLQHAAMRLASSLRSPFQREL